MFAMIQFKILLSKIVKRQVASYHLGEPQA
jgi:hypothetical protein